MTPFLIMIERIFLFYIRLKEQWFFLEIMTQRIELFWRNIYDSKNWTFFTKSKNWSFFTNMTHSKNSSLLNLFIWLKELNTFLNMTQRMEPFSQNDSKNWTFSSKWLKIFVLWIWLRIVFWLWLSERYCFVYFDSNNWTVFKIRPKGLNFFDWLINMTQRIVFSLMSHRIEHFFEHERIEPSSFFMTHIIEPFFFLETQLNTFPIQRIEHSFWTRLTELNSFLECDSKNWTGFSKNWLKELNLFSQSMTFNNEPFEKYDSKDWTF